MAPQDSAFVFPVHDLDAAGRDLAWPVSPEWLAAALLDTPLTPRGQAGEVRVHVSKIGREVLVRGRVRAAVSLPCARCLDPASLDVDAALDLLLEPAAPAVPASPARADRRGPKRGLRAVPAEPEAELGPLEAGRDVYEGEEVQLDAFVREAILLEEPSFPLCSEACEGIGPPAVPGAAPDPRLAVLANIVSLKSTKE